MAAPKGNKNAYKGDLKASSFLQIRLTQKEKLGWANRAASAHMTLTQYIKRKVNAEIIP